MQDCSYGYEGEGKIYFSGGEKAMIAELVEEFDTILNGKLPTDIKLESSEPITGAVASFQQVKNKSSSNHP